MLSFYHRHPGQIFINFTNNSTFGKAEVQTSKGQSESQTDKAAVVGVGVTPMGVGAVAAGGLASGSSAATDGRPPNVPSWTKSLGPGVLTKPYGEPSKHEAHVQRRTVDWLTADRIASISFTP